MDTSDMRELLQGYLSELNWAGGVTKDDIMECLVERDDALVTMLNEYIAEGTYQHLNDVMTLIPAQAWQDVQGDAWRGVESQYVEDVETNFREGPLGQRERDANQTTTASASGSGSARHGGSASGSSTAGGQGANSTPHAGNPGDGAGRIEDPGTQHAGVWPVSGPPSGNPDARIQGMASFGQGERGAAGYEDSGRSEVVTIPPEGGEPKTGSGKDSGSGSGHAGEPGSNAGEVDPGVPGTGETVGDTGNTGSGNGRR